MSRIIVTALAFAAGCDSPAAPGSPLGEIERTPSAPDVAGAVAEVVSAGSYAYLRVDDRWYATLDRGLLPGDAVVLDPIGRATNFHSRRTDRTFTEVWFAGVSSHPLLP